MNMLIEVLMAGLISSTMASVIYTGVVIATPQENVTGVMAGGLMGSAIGSALFVWLVMQWVFG